MTAVEVCGVGFFSPGVASLEALASGRHDPAAATARPTLGSRRHLRYTSDVTKMAIVACEQAIAGASLALDELNVIFASSQGEIQIAVELLDKIANEGNASPARFMNSVHNTVCGHLSIAAKSHGAFSALAGSTQTVAAAFIEAYALIATGDCESVVVICADERLPPPLDADDYDSLAAAFFLRGASDGDAGASRPILAAIVRDETTAPYAASQALRKNPCAPALGVLAALAEKRAGRVRLDGEGDEGWCVEIAYR